MENIESKVISAKKQRGISADEGGLKEKASYTPSSSIDEFAYGKDGGKANLQSGNVPSIQVGGSFEEAALPEMPGTLRIGDDKNVSTPVSG